MGQKEKRILRKAWTGKNYNYNVEKIRLILNFSWKELEERCVTVTKQESKEDYVRQNQKYQNTHFSGRNNSYFPADRKDLEVSVLLAS